MSAPAPRSGAGALALKEWSAVVHALLDGRQTVLLRKGGVGEKRFRVAPENARTPFLLFPTVAHSHRARVRPEHHDLLGPADADSTEGELLIRGGARIVATIAVTRPENLASIGAQHIWTEESVRSDRVEFRPRHLLTTLVVSAIPLAQPIRLQRTAAYRGCTSWVRLPVTSPCWGAAVHDDAILDDVAESVRVAVG